MKKLLILLLLSTSFSTFADSHLDFSLSKFCYLDPRVQDREGVYYFPNKEVGITAKSLCVFKDSYGQYHSKGKLKKGKLDGKWTWWNEDGQKTAEVNYNEGIERGEDGSFITRYENGQIEYKRIYIDGKKDGQIEYERYFKDGKKVSEISYEYYSNGQISEEVNYKDGKKNGKQTVWYSNGQIMLEKNYKDDKRYGKSTMWYSNGQIGRESNYKNEKLDGKWTNWYENGQIEKKTNYKDGKNNGNKT